MWPQLLALIVLPVAALQPSILGHGIVGRTSSVRQGPVVAMAGFGAKKVVKKPVKPKYNGKETVLAHMKTYDALARTTPATNQVDVYVRSSKSNKFWYVGKSLAQDGICNAAESVVLQKRVILEHGKLLQRELELAKELQLWTAPRNTEIKVAERRQPLTSLEGVRVSKELIAQALDGPKVGFEPEQYQDPSVGFYVRLQDDGTPADGSEFTPRYVSADNLGDELAKEDKQPIIV